MNTDRIPNHAEARNHVRPQNDAIVAASRAYWTALCDFGEGRISWATLRQRYKALRRAMGRRQ